MVSKPVLSELIATKLKFERILYGRGVAVKSYQADNGIFNAEEFEEEIKKENQGITFSGVGAQHQNDVAERLICTVIERAWTSLTHAAMRNPDNINATLWTFALSHACHIWNEVPKEGSFSPSQILSKSFSRDALQIIKSLRVWECPVYILDYRVASGKKIPKWELKSRRGVYLGPSPAHGSNVSLVLTLKTGHVTPQYRVVFDDCFSTVESGGRDDGIAELWQNLFSFSKSTFDYMSDEDDVFEASRFEREKEDRTAKRKYDKPLNNQPGSKPTKSGVQHDDDDGEKSPV